MNEQKDYLKTAIVTSLESKIEDMFIDLQKYLGIVSGDISPEDALELDAKVEEVAAVMAKVLRKQKGGAYK